MRTPLDKLLDDAVRVAMAYQGDEKIVKAAIHQALTKAVLHVSEECCNQVTSEIGLSETAQRIFNRIDEKIPTTIVSTDLLSPLNMTED